MRLTLSLQLELEEKGKVRRMAKEWIEKLAHDIKHKDHEAAKVFARQEHVKTILAERVPAFFAHMAKILQEDCAELNNALTGDPTFSPISVGLIGNLLLINRANFPFVKAQFNSSASGTLTLDLSQAPEREQVGVTTGTYRYHFVVSEHDGMTLHELDGAEPKTFERPDEFAKHVMELLFRV